MKYKVIVTIVLLLALAPLVSAATISDLAFRSGGADVVTIGGPTSQFTPEVIMSFSIQTTTDLVSVTTDLTLINPNPIYGYETNEILTSFCEREENSLGELIGYSCAIPELRLKPIESSLELPFNVCTAGPNNQAICEELLLSASFTIDTSQPTATDIRSGYCYDDECYIPAGRPTSISVQVNDDSEFPELNIFSGLVRFRVGGDVRAFQTCADGLCETQSYTFSNCESGQIVPLRLDTASTDLVGNKFAEYIKRDLICDSEPPSNVEISITKLGTNQFYKTGDDMFISVLVDEDVSGIVATANFSTLIGNNESQSGDCEPVDSNTYNCTWLATDIIEGNHILEFEFTDRAGRSTVAPMQETVNVLFYNATETTTPAFFRNVEGTPNSQAGYSRLAIDIATAPQNGMVYPVYATFEPRQIGGGSVEILKTQVTRCWYDNLTNTAGLYPPANAFANWEIGDQYNDYADNPRNRIDFRFQPQLNAMPNKFGFICEVEADVKRGEKIYSQPAVFNVTVPIILKDAQLGSIGEKFAEKIVEKEKLIDGELFNTIEKIGNVLSKVSQVCTAVNTGVTGYAAIAGGETTLAACGALGIPGCGSAGEALGKAREGIDKVAGPAERDASGFAKTLGNVPVVGEALEDVGNIRVDEKLAGNTFAKNWLNLEEGDTIFDAACKLATCSAAERADEAGVFGLKLNQFETSYYVDGTTGAILDRNTHQASDITFLEATGENIKAGFSEDFLQGVGIPDPKDSIVSAVNAQCLPAIIYHVEKYRHIECEQLSCLKIMAQNGGDISVCSQLKGQAICQAVISEAMSVNPLQAPVQLLANINTVVQNSVPAITKNIVSAAPCAALDFANNKLGNDAASGKDVGIKKLSAVKLAYMLSCEMPKSIGKIAYQTEENSHGSGSFAYPDLGDSCDYSVCNDVDRSGCPGRPPEFLQEFLFNSQPAHNVPITLDAQKGLNFVNSFNYDDPSYNDIIAFNQITGLDYAKLDNDEVEDAIKIAQTRLQSANELGIPVIIDATGIRLDYHGKKYGQAGDKSWRELNTELLDIQAEINKEAIKAGLAQTQFGQAWIDFIADGGEFIQTPDGEIIAIEERILKDESELSSTTRVRKEDGSIEEVDVDWDIEIPVLEEASFPPPLTLTNSELRNLEDLIKLSKDKSALAYSIKQASHQYELDIEKEKENLQSLIVDGITVEEKAKIEEKISELDKLREQLDEFSLKQLQIEEAFKRSREVQAGISLSTDLIARKLFQGGALDFMQWEDGTGIGRALDVVDDILSPDNRNQLICNGFLDLTNAEGFDGGSAVQCSDGYCNPVLSFGAEKIRADSENYLYTVTWFLGNVFLEDQQDPRGEYLKYNAFLQGGGPELKLGEGTWVDLAYGSGNFDNPQISFLYPENYDRICIKFRDSFPPNSGNSKREYCRPIADTTSQPSFGTGAPVSDLYFSNPNERGYCSANGADCTQQTPGGPNTFTLSVGE